MNNVIRAPLALPDGTEIRSVPFAFAGRSSGPAGAAAGTGNQLVGYAGVFGQTTRISSWEGDFTEEFQRGAFRDSLARRTPLLQWDHGGDTRVGSTPIGRYTDLIEDERGLKVVGELYRNAVVEPLRQAIAGGDLGMSIRFRVLDDEWSDTRDGRHRVVREVELLEAGPVAWPAYGGTSVGLRTAGYTPGERAARLRAHTLRRLAP